MAWGMFAKSRSAVGDDGEYSGEGSSHSLLANPHLFALAGAFLRTTSFTVLMEGGQRPPLGQEALLPFPLFPVPLRSEEHTSELQSLMRISYAAFCLKKTT